MMGRWMTSLAALGHDIRRLRTAPRLFQLLYAPKREPAGLAPVYPAEVGVLDTWRSLLRAHRRLKDAFAALDAALAQTCGADHEALKTVLLLNAPTTLPGSTHTSSGRAAPGTAVSADPVHQAVAQVRLELAGLRGLGWASHCLRQRTLPANMFVLLGSMVTTTPFKIPLLMYRFKLKRRFPEPIADRLMQLLLQSMPNALGTLDHLLRQQSCKNALLVSGAPDHGALSDGLRRDRRSANSGDSSALLPDPPRTTQASLLKHGNSVDPIESNVKPFCNAQRAVISAARVRRKSYKNAVRLAVPLSSRIAAEAIPFSSRFHDRSDIAASDPSLAPNPVQPFPLVLHASVRRTDNATSLRLLDINYGSIHQAASLITDASHTRTALLKAHHETYQSKWCPLLVPRMREALLAQYRLAQNCGYPSPLHMAWGTTLGCAEATRHSLDDVERRVITPCFEACQAVVQLSASRTATKSKPSYVSWMGDKQHILYRGLSKDAPHFGVKMQKQNRPDTAMAHAIVAFLGHLYDIAFTDISTSSCGGPKGWNPQTLILKAEDQRSNLRPRQLGYVYFLPYHQPTLSERVAGVSCPGVPEATIMLPGHYLCKGELPPLHSLQSPLLSLTQLTQALHELGHTIHFLYYYRNALEHPGSSLVSSEMYLDVNETFSQLAELSLHLGSAASYFDIRCKNGALGAPFLGDLYVPALRSQIELDIYGHFPEDALQDDTRFLQAVTDITQRRVPYTLPDWYHPLADADASCWLPHPRYNFMIPYLLGRLRAVELFASLQTKARPGTKAPPVNPTARDLLKDFIFQDPTCLLTSANTQEHNGALLSVVNQKPLFAAPHSAGRPALESWASVTPAVLDLDPQKAAAWKACVSKPAPGTCSVQKEQKKTKKYKAASVS